MKGLITDRNQNNVLRLAELSAKGMNMTEEERAEWNGDIFLAEGVNLLRPGEHYASTVGLKYTNDAIVAEALVTGNYLLAILVIGDAANYDGKTLTFSADYIGSAGGGNPGIQLMWHDASGSTPIGSSMTEAGSFTVTANNTNGHEKLAAYLYATTSTSVEAGTAAVFRGLMLEFGDTRHEYVPYTDILPTDTTKGAYNYSDLNRVERAASELSDRLGLNLGTKIDWAMWDVPGKAEMVRFIDNIKAIRDVLASEIAIIPDSMNELTYGGANNIERLLLEGYESTQSSCCSGELFCGEV